MDSKLAKWLERWEKIREKGKWHYIIKYWVIGWGFLTGFLYALIFPLVIAFIFDREISFLLILFYSLALFPIGGLVGGLFIWNRFEKIYLKEKGL